MKLFIIDTAKEDIQVQNFSVFETASWKVIDDLIAVDGKLVVVYSLSTLLSDEESFV
jgi:hypothetical protein